MTTSQLGDSLADVAADPIAGADKKDEEYAEYTSDQTCSPSLRRVLPDPEQAPADTCLCLAESSMWLLVITKIVYLICPGY